METQIVRVNPIELAIVAGLEMPKVSPIDLLANPGLVIPEGQADLIWNNPPKNEDGTLSADPKAIHDYEQAAIIRDAHVFSERFDSVAPVIKAAEDAEQSLSQIPVSIARYCQTLYKDPSYTKGRADRRLAKYKELTSGVALELFRLHNIPETLGSMTDRLNSFPKGRYWLRLTSIARQALVADIDLHAVEKTTGVQLYRTIGQIEGAAKAVKAALKAKSAASDAAPPAGTGADTNGPVVDRKPLQLSEALPSTVHGAMSRLNSAVTDIEYKVVNANVEHVVARILTIATKLVLDAGNEDFEQSDCDWLMAKIAAYQGMEHVSSRVFEEARARIDSEEKPAELDADLTEVVSDADIAELEEAQHEEATHDLPGLDTEAGDEPRADVNG